MTALVAMLLSSCGALLDLPDAPEHAAKPHARGARAGGSGAPGHRAPADSAEPERPLVPIAPLGASVDAGRLTPVASGSSDAGLVLAPLAPGRPADAGPDASAERVP